MKVSQLNQVSELLEKTLKDLPEAEVTETDEGLTITIKILKRGRPTGQKKEPVPGENSGEEKA